MTVMGFVHLNVLVHVLGLHVVCVSVSVCVCPATSLLMLWTAASRGRRPGRHLAGGSMGRLHTTTKKIRMVSFVQTVFYRSFVRLLNIMSPCESINLVGVGALILVCELGRLLPGNVSQTYERWGERQRYADLKSPHWKP